MLFYFIIPIIIINYLLIFKKSKYKSLIKEFKKNYNKKLFVGYFIIAILFVYIILFTKNNVKGIKPQGGASIASASF